jgi:hypothetical protein
MPGMNAGFVHSTNILVIVNKLIEKVTKNILRISRWNRNLNYPSCIKNLS